VPEVLVAVVQGAEHEVALVEDQVRVLVALANKVVGLATRETITEPPPPPARFITTESVAESVPSVQTIVMVIGLLTAG